MKQIIQKIHEYIIPEVGIEIGTVDGIMYTLSVMVKKRSIYTGSKKSPGHY